MRTALLAVGLLMSLAACLGSSAPPFEAVSRTLDSNDPDRNRLGEAEVLGILELRSGKSWFGGISGLSFDGTTVTGVTDKGWWLSFHLEVDRDGRPVSVSDLKGDLLGGRDGGKKNGDSEDLLRTPDGWLVSFEYYHRLMLYPDGLAGKPVPQAPPENYDRQPANGGVEAVARLADGRLLLLSEEGGTDDVGWAWVGRPGAWQKLGYRRDGLFHPTSAVTLPDGDVLVTERRFTWLGGVALRLVRIDAPTIRPGAILQGRELFILQPPLLVDNYEGIALYQRQDGRLVAYIVSDDNFNPLQATLLMAVLLPQ